jgi:hypothetical protein
MGRSTRFKNSLRADTIVVDGAFPKGWRFSAGLSVLMLTPGNLQETKGLHVNICDLA